MDENISPTFRKEKYEWLRNHVRLDLMDIDEEVMEMPFLLQDAGECSSKATEIRDSAKDALTATASSLAHALRQEQHNGKPRSESMIESLIPVCSQYQEKLAELSTARLDASLWESLVDALRSKSMAIRVAADLLNSGYLTPDYIRNKRRREIRQAGATV